MSIENQGISRSDIEACKRLFEQRNLSLQSAAWRFNFDKDCWEVLDVGGLILPSPLANSDEGWR